MKMLVVEDDFSGRVLLQKLLNPYGEVHIAINGRGAVDAFGEQWDAYLVKPIDREKLFEQLQTLGLAA